MLWSFSHFKATFHIQMNFIFPFFSLFLLRLRHKLHFVEPDKKVLDANVHDIDRYELFDPRNPLNKRRREVSKQALREK